jgi:hypothetical protein
MHRVNQRRGHSGPQVELDLDLGTDRVLQHLAELDDQVVEVRGLRFEPRLASKGQELFRQLGAALGCAAGILQRPAQGFVVRA